MEKFYHNLEIAKPRFIYFIDNMGEALASGIQYSGVELCAGEQLYFKFKSSQHSLRFEVYCGVNTDGMYERLKGKTKDLYDYFRDLKHARLHASKT